MKAIILFTILCFSCGISSYGQDSITTIYLADGNSFDIKHNARWNIANYDTLKVFCEQHNILSELQAIGMLKDSFNRIIALENIEHPYVEEFRHLIDTTIQELDLKKKVGSLEFLHSNRFQYNIRRGSFGDRTSIKLTDTTISDNLRTILYIYSSCILQVAYDQSWKSYRDSVYTNIAKSYNLWTTFSTKGMFQYPWESFINGWYHKPTIQSPPVKQLIILHPSLGVQFQNILQNPVKEVLSVDLLGNVYYSADFRNYYSISLASFFRSDVGAGLGIKLGRNKFSCGIAFHDIDGKSGLFNESPLYFMSVNLFNLSQSKVEQFEKYRKTLEIKSQTQ